MELLEKELLEKQKRKIEETENLYAMLKAFCEENHYENALKALPFARKVHEGDYRRGEDKAPYYIHPLRVALQGALLGLGDIYIATAILHDTKEEKKHCNLNALDVTEEIKFYVNVLTYKGTKFSLKEIEKKREAQTPYYKEIEKYYITTYLKGIDRRDCLSTMTGGAFEKEKMFEYLDETNTFFPTLFENARAHWPEDTMKFYSIENDINALVQTVSGIWMMADDEIVQLKMDKYRLEDELKLARKIS